MNQELYINDKRIELGSPEARIALTLQVNDMAELKNRQGNFSNKFRIPKSNFNRSALEHSDNPSSFSNLPYTKLSCRYVQEGVPLVQNGVAIIESADDFYNIVIYSGNVFFFDKIEGKTIRDLDLSAHDHIWNLSNAVSSRLNSDGYIYPIIDWSSDGLTLSNANKDVDVRYQFPSMFGHTLLSKIAEENDTTFEGDILSDSFFKNIIVPTQTREANQEIKSSLLSKATQTINVFQNLGAGSFLMFKCNTELFDPINRIKNETLSLTTSPFNSSPLNFQTYTVFQAGNYTFTWLIKKSGAGGIKMYKLPNGSNTPSVIYTSGALTSAPTTITLTQALNQGDKIFAVMTEFPSPNGGVGYLAGSNFECTSVDISNIVFGATWGVAMTLPNISQTNFIKTFAHLFGIIFQTDSITNKVQWRQFKEIKQNIAQAKNWSNKIDKNVMPSLDFRIGNYARSNFMRYKNDDSVDEGLGDGHIDVADETLETRKDIVVLSFSASESVTRLVGETVCIVERLVAGVDKLKFEPRIFALNKKAVANVNYKDGTSTSTQSTSIPLGYFIDNNLSQSLSFGNNIIKNNYSELQSVLQQTKKVVANFNLTQQDIQELDFFIPIHLSVNNEKFNLNGYFFINKIIQFLPDRSTAVELIRL